MLSLNSDRYSGLRFNLRLISREEGSMILIITNPCIKKEEIYCRQNSSKNKSEQIDTPNT